MNLRLSALFLLFISSSIFLEGCKPIKKLFRSRSPKKSQSAPSNDETSVAILSLDPRLTTLIPEIERSLLLGNPEAGEIYFNPGREREFLPTTGSLPVIRFATENANFPLGQVEDWLKTSAPGQGLRLHLKLRKPLIIPRSYRERFPSQQAPSATLLRALYLRLKNGIQPKSYALSLLEPQSPLTAAEDPRLQSLPVFFQLLRSSTLEGTLEAACQHLASHLAAAQLLQKLYPENSLRIDLDCVYLLQQNDSEKREAEGSLEIMNLAFPWVAAGTKNFPFKNLDSFFESESYLLPKKK